MVLNIDIFGLHFILQYVHFQCTYNVLNHKSTELCKVNTWVKFSLVPSYYTVITQSSPI